MEKLTITDKEFVVVALMIIGVVALAVMGAKAENIVTAIVAGLSGLAVGKSLN